MKSIPKISFILRLTLQAAAKTHNGQPTGIFQISSFTMIFVLTVLSLNKHSGSYYSPVPISLQLKFKNVWIKWQQKQVFLVSLFFCLIQGGGGAYLKLLGVECVFEGGRLLEHWSLFEEIRYLLQSPLRKQKKTPEKTFNFSPFGNSILSPFRQKFSYLS